MCNFVTNWCIDCNSYCCVYDCIREQTHQTHTNKTQFLHFIVPIILNKFGFVEAYKKQMFSLMVRFQSLTLKCFNNSYIQYIKLDFSTIMQFLLFIFIQIFFIHKICNNGLFCEKIKNCKK